MRRFLVERKGFEKQDGQGAKGKRRETWENIFFRLRLERYVLYLQEK
jgi:hypothetical protein